MRFYFIIFTFLLLFSSNTNCQIFMPAMRGAISSKPTIPTTMYSGGIGNGADVKSVIQNICPPLNVESLSRPCRRVNREGPFHGKFGDS